ncbi:MAG: methylated-DNA--[protein]-cysteine S-methyltransferase, partial [Alphaproteobacteria bacterium]
MRLLIDRLPSPIGNNFIIWDEAEHVRALDFEEYETRMHDLLQRHYRRYELIKARLPKIISEKLEAYFDGDICAIDRIPAANGGTPFQRDAWSALRAIPAGATRTYGQQAATIGKPKASRAVGAANGANPVVIIVPCHRVIGSTGKLTGFGGGLARKQWLLDHEKRY